MGHARACALVDILRVIRQGQRVAMRRYANITVKYNLGTTRPIYSHHHHHHPHYHHYCHRRHYQCSCCCDYCCCFLLNNRNVCLSRVSCICCCIYIMEQLEGPNMNIVDLHADYSVPNQQHRKSVTDIFEEDIDNKCPKQFGKSPHRRRARIVQSHMRDGDNVRFRLLYGSFGPRESAAITASLDRFSHFCTAHP